MSGTWRPPQDIDSAIEELRAESRPCPYCGIRFVYGRKGVIYCSKNCATRARRDRKRGRID